jgi:NADH:ubiquinone reductase (H+-translocating)
MSAQPTSIVIVGAGFAGTTLVRAMAGRLPPGVTVTLVSDESYTTFNPMLPEAVGASVFPEQVVVPVREMLPPAEGHRFIMGSVTQVDTLAQVLHCRTLAGELRLPYAHLVLAFGNRARLDLLPGMADHALPLKTAGDAMHIRNTVLRRLARIELESDPVLRRELGHFIVIGGGFSGVEVAGELVDCLHSIRRYYPQVRPDELQVTVLHGTERLLPELSPRLGEAALRSLLQRGVAVHLQTRAASVSDGCVQLMPVAGQATGAVLRGQTLICTIGTEPNPLACKLGLPMSGGRIVVAPDLSVPEHPGVWALGDCAAVPNALDGKVSPPTAQYAVRQARHLAHNLIASLLGQPTQPFSHQCRGMMASIGHLKGVAEVAGVPLTGWLAWLVWRGYYLSQMPSFGRKLRIFWEWTWGMFFPPDITHLRFTRSHELRMDEQRRQAEEAPQASDPWARHG